MVEKLTVGFVRGAHGVTGEFKVESASGEYEHIAVLEEVTLRRNDVEKLCKVEYAEPASGTLYMKLVGIDSPEDVRKYTGWEIVVPRKYAAPLAKGEWYIEDLRHCSLINGDKSKDGLAAKTAPAQQVGTITDVLEGGGGYLLEVSLSEGVDDSGSNRTVLVPFNKEFIGKVDVKHGTIELMHLWILE
ncbi:MAG: ribosome maturation factor RimM [Treponema sp.]|nr:ribosome maturation factor RimM [Treponema sp.]